MTRTPMEKLVEDVVKEWLTERDSKLSSIIEGIADELSPLIAQEVKGYFVRLVEDKEPSHQAQKMRLAIMHALDLIDLAEDLLIPPSRDQLAEMRRNFKEALGGHEHG
jgi:hypothetical protein